MSSPVQAASESNMRTWGLTLCVSAIAAPASGFLSAVQSGRFVAGIHSSHTCSSAKRARPQTAVPSMMFEQLTEKMSSISELLQGKKKITAASVERALVEVKRALLDADVNLKVTNNLITSVRNKAVGSVLIEGVSPDQQFIKIMYDELLELMGSTQAPLARSTKEGEPAVILLAGLQGAGKTTAAGKLAKYCRERGPPGSDKPVVNEDGTVQPKVVGDNKVLLVAADIYRPAAIEQLQKLGASVGVEVYSLGKDVSPPEIVRQGISYAKEGKFDTVIVDTAGRQIKQSAKPDEILLVVDAMTGQEAATLTAAFNERVGITGAVLTKLDGDTRGGSAISVQGVSGKPVKFVGVGERLEDLEPFYPDRMAGRILGMGDIVTLVEKAQQSMSNDEMEKVAKRMMDATFDFNDYLKQANMVKGMGSIAGVAKMIPGMAGKISQKQLDDAEDRSERAEKVIGAMQPEERSDPELLLSSASANERIRRIAKDAEMRSAEVNTFISEFKTMRNMMAKMSKRMGGQEGEDPNQAARMPTEEDMAAMGNRAQRRQAARQNKKGGGATSRGFGKR